MRQRSAIRYSTLAVPAAACSKPLRRNSGRSPCRRADRHQPGVASGSVYIKGGFYFHDSVSPEGVEFEGYIELGGRLSVLGLITISPTFHLSLTYESKALPDKADGRPHRQNRLFGQATLVVEIEILIFSASVKVKVEKTFAGSGSDPLFRDFITDQSVWNEYCDAFA